MFFDFILDIIYKSNKFLRFFFKKSFKLVLRQKNGFVIFNFCFMLLSIKVNLILKNENCKKYIFIFFSFSNFKIVFVLLIKVVVFYLLISII